MIAMQYLVLFTIMTFSSFFNSEKLKSIEPRENDFHIFFDSCKFIENVKDTTALRIKTYFTLKNTGLKDIIIMKYSCENGNVLNSFNILLQDTIFSKIYSLQLQNIYDINPVYLLDGPRFENSEYYILKFNQKLHVSQEFQINLSDSISNKGNGMNIVNICDNNDMFKGNFRNFNVKIALSNYPCPNTSGEYIKYCSDFFIKPGVYYSNWIDFK